MNRLTIILLFVTSSVFGQLTLPEAKTAALEYNLLSYSYHTAFEGHAGYAAPIIITTDGGTIFFGASDDEVSVNVVKLDTGGNPEWSVPVIPLFDEMETQSVIQDKSGNYYAFVLSYNYSIYRGGSERVIKLDADGNMLWDVMLGDYGLLNSPQCSYIHLQEDGLLELRGHMVEQAATEGNDPEYRFWTGWLNSEGELTSETGEIIDWSDPAWHEFLEVQE